MFARMGNRISNLAIGIFGAKIFSRAKWSWLAYAVSFYAGLRLLRRYGIFTRQSDRMIRMMERGADAVAQRTPGLLH